MKTFAIAALCVLLAACAVGPALAQTTVNLGDLFAPWAEMLIGAFAVLVTAILGWIAAQIKAKTGIDIEARHREALQTALTNAAGLVLSKLHGKAAEVEFDLRSVAVAQGVRYVMAAVPDAVERFGLSPEQLAEKLVAKLGLVTAPAAAPVQADE